MTILTVLTVLLSVASCGNGDVPEEPQFDTPETTAVGSTAAVVVEREVVVTEVVTEYVYIDVIPGDYEYLMFRNEILSDIELESMSRHIKMEISAPYLTAAWDYLLDAGYNKHVVAGILGNMMVESGKDGDIRPTVYNGVHYGICQWDTSKDWAKNVVNADLEGQLKYLVYEYFKISFVDYYKNSKNGWEYYYNQFINLPSASEAAAMFAKVCERPKNTNYANRQLWALKIYEMFN